MAENFRGHFFYHTLYITNTDDYDKHYNTNERPMFLLPNVFTMHTEVHKNMVYLPLMITL